MGRSQALVVLLSLFSMMGVVEVRALRERQDTSLSQSTPPINPPSDPLSKGGISFPLSTPSQTGTSGSTSSTTSSAQPSATHPSLTFQPISNLSTCTSETISWHYSGPPATLNVSVTNSGQQQNPTTQLVFMPIESGIILGPIGSLVWPSVNVIPGTYIVQGYTQGDTFSSAPFSVADGSDVSCISSQTSSSSQATNTGSSDLSDTTSSSNLSGGDIAGIVIGSLAFACIIIVAYLAWRLFKRRNTDPRGSSGYREKRAWGGLGSMDSHHTGSAGENRLIGDQGARNIPHATELGTPSRGRALSMNTQGKGSPVPSEDDLMTLTQNTPDNESPITPLGAAVTAKDGFPAHIDPINYSRPARLSDPQIRPNGGSKNIKSGGAKPTRRTSTMRKPVPAYRPGEPIEAHELTVDPMRNFSSSVGRMSGSQSSINLSIPSIGENPFIGGLELPALNHKSSFGDRAMHVLIPDMPSPQQTRM